MSRNSRMASPEKPVRVYRGVDVPLREIRRFARRVAERFAPDRIILFGSHAYGTPHADSDVDILVVMPARNRFDKAYRICHGKERQKLADVRTEWAIEL